MSTRHHELSRIAGRQHGLVTWAQLREAGFTEDMVRHDVRTGRLVRLRRGVFRVAGAPVTRQQAWLTGVLAAGPGAVLSHLTAAHAWGLRYFPDPERIDVLLTGRRTAVPGMRAHHTQHLPPRHRTTLRSIPITTAERTLIDACGALSYGRLERSLDDALRHGLLDLERLRRTAREVPLSGRRRILPVRGLLAARSPGFDPGGSHSELDVMRVLRRAGIDPLPQQQYRVEIEGHTYFLDFAWPETRHAIEFDSYFAHGMVSDHHRDRERTRRLQRADWTIWSVTERAPDAEVVDIGRRATRAPRAA